MGACASSAKESQDDAQVVKYAPESNGVKRSTVAAEAEQPPQRKDNVQPSETVPRDSVQVEFNTADEQRRSRPSTGNAYSQAASTETEVRLCGSIR